ncbi:MAG: SDR family oxidoreductase [Candidatus Kapabacteria bacterium]|nr:SDR family oxidoreductase [Candidatus Kapabacteria bacterium]
MPVAIVVGGARRIGAAIVRGLADEGYDVGFTYHTSQSAAEKLSATLLAAGRKVSTARCDITDPDALTHALHELSSVLGHAHVVISCAGVFPPAAAVQDLTEQHMTEAFRANTLPLLTIARQYRLQCYEYQQSGRIVVIGSLGAREIWRDRAAYNVSKAALMTLAHSLARSLAPQISINTVAPGAIAQPLERRDTDSSLVDVSRIPMQRYGEAADVVDAVRYFARCSPYITGQTIVVDGGYGLVR